MKHKVKIVGFDADDTLWINEPFYRDTEKQFCDILASYSAEKETNEELFKKIVDRLNELNPQKENESD